MAVEKRKRKTTSENVNLIKSKTLNLIGEHGYANVSMNNISEETGINISLIYRYFPKGKPEILKAIGEDLIQNSNFKPMIGEISNPLVFLTQFNSRIIAAHRQFQTILQSLTIAYLSNKEIFNQDNFDIITGDLRDPLLFINLLRKLGVPDTINLEYEARMIFQLIDSMIHRHITTIPINESDEKLASYLADIIINRVEALKKAKNA